MIIKLNPKPRPKSYPALFVEYKKSMVLIGLIVTALLSLYADRPFCQYINNNGTPIDGIASLFSSLIKPIHFLVFIPFFYFLNKILWKSEKIERSLFMLVMILPCIYIAAAVIESVIPKTGPSIFLASGKYGLSWGHATEGAITFPSKASAMTGALIAAMGYTRPSKSWHLFAMGLAVCLCEAISLKAFLSDAFFGYILGILLGQMLYVKIKAKKLYP